MVDIHVLTTASGRLAAIAPLRGVWREIEAEIERRNASGGDRAATTMLFDLQELTTEEGSQADFRRRLASILVRHEKKGKFIERLNRLGCDNDERTA